MDVALTPDKWQLLTLTRLAIIKPRGEKPNTQALNAKALLLTTVTKVNKLVWEYKAKYKRDHLTHEWSPMIRCVSGLFLLSLFEA